MRLTRRGELVMLWVVVPFCTVAAGALLAALAWLTV